MREATGESSEGGGGGGGGGGASKAHHAAADYLPEKYVDTSRLEHRDTASTAASTEAPMDTATAAELDRRFLALEKNLFEKGRRIVSLEGEKRSLESAVAEMRVQASRLPPLERNLFEKAKRIISLEKNNKALEATS